MLLFYPFWGVLKSDRTVWFGPQGFAGFILGDEGVGSTENFMGPT